MSEAHTAPDPLTQLRLNNEAIGWFSWPASARRQFSLSVMTLQASVPPEQFRMDEKTADLVYRVSRSAGDYPVVYIARLHYLLMGERWKTDKAEVEAILTTLKKQAAYQPLTWMFESIYASRIDDKDRVLKAVLAGFLLEPPLFASAAKALGVQLETSK